jgi:two-component system phosphate regulon sensor histidine kinase PhoR
VNEADDDGLLSRFRSRARPGWWLALAAVAAGILSVAVYGVPWLAAAAAVLVVLAAAVVDRRPGQHAVQARRTDRGTTVWPDSGMRAVVEGLQDPCFLTDSQGLVRFANRAATARFGAIPLGSPLRLRIRTTVLHDALDRAILLDEAETIGWMEKIPAEQWFEARIAPIHRTPAEAGSSSPPDFVLVAIVDQTEQRRTERMRADFVANASHELRTPLASLSGFIETLQGPARNDPAARERFLAVMVEQARRMTRLIDDLLSLSRVEMKAHLRPNTPVDLTEVVRSVADVLAPLATDSKVSVSLEGLDAPMPVLGDRDELVQVFANLIENAIKYGGSGGAVEVRAVREADPGPAWAVSVVDHGPGIAAEHLPRLTERFYRADVATSREKQGTGLGLAIAKHILARHRARLDIRSRLGEGATFTVRIDAHTP